MRLTCFFVLGQQFLFAHCLVKVTSQYKILIDSHQQIRGLFELEIVDRFSRDTKISRCYICTTLRQPAFLDGEDKYLRLRARDGRTLHAVLEANLLL